MEGGPVYPMGKNLHGALTPWGFQREFTVFQTLKEGYSSKYIKVLNKNVFQKELSKLFKPLLDLSSDFLNVKTDSLHE